jgi:hypothetical protein
MAGAWRRGQVPGARGGLRLGARRSSAAERSTGRGCPCSSSQPPRHTPADRRPRDGRARWGDPAAGSRSGRRLARSARAGPGAAPVERAGRGPAPWPWQATTPRISWPVSSARSRGPPPPPARCSPPRSMYSPSPGRSCSRPRVWWSGRRRLMRQRDSNPCRRLERVQVCGCMQGFLFRLGRLGAIRGNPSGSEDRGTGAASMGLQVAVKGPRGP